jgi:hypothetical protein
MTLANKLVAAITSLHVLAHSVFGCCGHDMHGGSKAAAIHRCKHSATDVTEANVCQHSRAKAVAVSHAANRVASVPSLDEASTLQPAHQCRHAGCHWKTGEACPDIKLLAASTHAAIVAAVPVIYTHDRSIGPAIENDVGRYCALRLRLQLMSGVLQI